LEPLARNSVQNHHTKIEIDLSQPNNLGVGGGGNILADIHMGQTLAPTTTSLGT